MSEKIQGPELTHLAAIDRSILRSLATLESEQDRYGRFMGHKRSTQMSEDTKQPRPSDDTGNESIWLSDKLRQTSADLATAQQELEAARVPLCIGQSMIEYMADNGQWCSEDGRGVIAADELFHQNPYDKIEKLERELKDAKSYGQIKDETATTFMNQVKKLHRELAELRAQLEQEKFDSEQRIEHQRQIIERQQRELEQEKAESSAMCQMSGEVAVHTLTCIHHTDPERAAIPSRRNCPICAKEEQVRLQRCIDNQRETIEKLHDDMRQITQALWPDAKVGLAGCRIVEGIRSLRDQHKPASEHVGLSIGELSARCLRLQLDNEKQQQEIAALRKEI